MLAKPQRIKILIKENRIKINEVKLYHGSPYGLENFNDFVSPLSIAFFTPSKELAMVYTKKDQVVGAQKNPHSNKKNEIPTILTCEVEGNFFDLRNEKHRELYKDIAISFNERNQDPDDRIPINVNKVLTPGVGLAPYPFASSLREILIQKGFDGMWVDEGSYITSLAVYDWGKCVKVLDITKIEQINEVKKPKNFELLFEMSVKDVLGTVGSKATRKIIYQYKMLEAGERKISDPRISDQIINYLVNDLINAITSNVPYDLNDNQKGLSAAWLKKMFLSSYDVYKKYMIDNKDPSAQNRHLLHNLEEYFKVQRFVKPNERDLMNVSDVDGLRSAIEYAMPKYKAHLEKKDYADASKGTEKIYEDDKYDIFIPHNKGAACQLGKGTTWCTAAPGLDYYEQYHKPDDPLFVIFRKWKENERENVSGQPEEAEHIEKFQFHYGTSQFMNEDDEQVYRHPGGVKIIKEIHRILLKTVGDKFPFLKDAFIETDVGLSIKETYEDSNSQTFGYKDLKTGIAYGGDEKPYVSVAIYEDEELGGLKLFFNFFWNKAILNKDMNLKFNPARDDGPYTIKIAYRETNGDIYLIRAAWAIEGGEDVASYEKDGISVGIYSNPNYTLNVRDQTAWKSMEGFGQQFETKIKGREEEYAKEILMKYLPDELKQKYFSQG